MLRQKHNAEVSKRLSRWIFSAFFRSKIMITAGLLIIGLFHSPGIFAFESVEPLDRLQTADSQFAETGLNLLERVVWDFWSGTGDTKEMTGNLNRAADAFAAVTDSEAGDYLLARVELYRGMILLTEGKKAAARTDLEKSMDLSNRSLSKRNTSEGYRVLADALSIWMVSKGLFGIIKMAPQVKEWSEKALDLDPQNILAILISTQGEINAPRNAGGNPERALQRLLELHARSDLSEVERFRTRVSLAQVYAKLNRSEESDSWRQRARDIFPDNPMIQDSRR